MWECSALGAELKNVHSFTPRASVGLRGDLGAYFSEATASAIFGVVGLQLTLGSNHRVCAPEPKGRATRWAALVAWPVVSLLRSPECNRNIAALDLGPWGGKASCKGVAGPCSAYLVYLPA